MNDALLRYARDIMRGELKRYAVPEDTHVSLEEPLEGFVEATADAVQLRMIRIGPGFGRGAPYDFAVIHLPGQLLRDPKAMGRALRDGVAGACKKLFGPHDGEGLP